MGTCNAVCCLVVQDANISRSYTIAKWVYCFLFTVLSVVTWVLRDYSEEWFLTYSSAFTYCHNTGLEALCSSKQVAVRFSFANVSFFGAHALLLFWCRRASDPRAGLHSSLWIWKLLIWGGAIVGFFFVPSYVVVIYAQIARFVAGAFLVFIMIEMVSWVYEVNECLVSKDSCLSWTALVLGASISVLGGLALVGASYYFYAPTLDCRLNLFFICWSVVVGCALVGVLFIPRRLEVAGLLTSGAVFLYCSYLLYSALGRIPGNECQRAVVSDRWVQVREGVCFGQLDCGQRFDLGYLGVCERLSETV